MGAGAGRDSAGHSAEAGDTSRGPAIDTAKAWAGYTGKPAGPDTEDEVGRNPAGETGLIQPGGWARPRGRGAARGTGGAGPAGAAGVTGAATSAARRTGAAEAGAADTV